MERLKCREDDENDKLVPTGTVGLLLANVEELYEVCNKHLVAFSQSPMICNRF